MADVGEIVGRVVGNNVTEIRLRTRYGVRVKVGEMLVAEDSDDGASYLLRAYDVRYGAEASGDDWMERTAGGMLLLDAKNQRADLVDKERRLYYDVYCIPLGYVRGGVFLRSKTLPSHFSRVRRARAEDYDVLRGKMGTVEVGFLRNGDEVIEYPVGISEESFPYHIGIFATTGMGKSNLMKCLAASVMKNREAGLLLLDPHGEYYDGGGPGRLGLKDFPGAESGLVVYSARRLRGDYRSIRLSPKEIKVQDLARLYNFSEAQREALVHAEYRLGDMWLVHLHDMSVEDLKDGALSRFSESTIQVIKRRIDHLFRFNLVSRNPDVSMTASVLNELRNRKVVLVDTSNMYEAEELLVSTVLARGVFESNKSLYGDVERFRDIPPVLITIEEAQRVLGPGHGGIFAQIAREGRKFKTGLCAISQQPKLIDREVISQFNTLFILGLADRRDREILTASAKQDVSRLDNEIQTLSPGEGIITSPFTPFAVPVKVHLYEEYVERERETGRERESEGGGGGVESARDAGDGERGGGFDDGFF